LPHRPAFARDNKTTGLAPSSIIHNLGIGRPEQRTISAIFQMYRKRQLGKSGVFARDIPSKSIDPQFIADPRSFAVADDRRCRVFSDCDAFLTDADRRVAG
jgi:hypothetical protein